VHVLEIPHVQPVVHDSTELADEVFALHIADESVRVGETETQSVTERWQQTIIVKLVHHKLRKFEYRAIDTDRLPLCAKVFHHRQILVDDRRTLVGCFRNTAYKLRQIGNQMDAGALVHVFHRLAIKCVGDQFVQRRLEVRVRIFPPIVAKSDEWQHVGMLRECNDVVYLVQS